MPTPDGWYTDAEVKEAVGELGEDDPPVTSKTQMAVTPNGRIFWRISAGYWATSPA